jgi:hypothetical protein
VRDTEATLFDDPLDVLVEQAKLVEQYRKWIGEAAEDILRRFPGPPPPTVAAAVYIKFVGRNIPDEAIRRAVKNAAIIEFGRRGVMV